MQNLEDVSKLYSWPAIQFEAIQIADTLTVHTNLVFNNMLFQGSPLAWQDCRYELLPYLHIPLRCSGA